jgi:type II secretory pathway component PulC
MIKRLSERHIVALNYLLITVLAYFAALSANDLLTDRYRNRSENPVVRAVAGRAEPSPSHSRSDYQAIVDRDIFNLEVKPVAAPPPVVEDLHLTLIGVSQMSHGKPFAIIQDQRGVQAVYRVGETIPDSGKLVAVEADRAILDHDGQKVAVTLPQDEIAVSRGLRRLGMERPIDESDQGQAAESSEPDSPEETSSDTSPDSSEEQDQ